MEQHEGYEQLMKQLNAWIAEDGEISIIARRVKARLPDPDDIHQLRVEVKNMRNYFKR